MSTQTAASLTSAPGLTPAAALAPAASLATTATAGTDATPSPDYGWSDASPEESHSYLDPVVLAALRTALAPKQTQGSTNAPRVFDAGCGNGALLVTLLNEGYAVAGCELSAPGTGIARRTLGARARVENMSVYEDLAGTFGAGWDAVVSTEVIEHLYAPRDFVRRARDLLKVGGTLVLTTPYHGYVKNLVMALTGTLDKHFTALWDGGHIKFWSYATLTALLAESDFGDFQFRGAGRCPGLWKSMVVSATRIR